VIGGFYLREEGKKVEHRGWEDKGENAGNSVSLENASRCAKSPEGSYGSGVGGGKTKGEKKNCGGTREGGEKKRQKPALQTHFCSPMGTQLKMFGLGVS